MIFGTVLNKTYYDLNEDKFQTAFAFLARKDLQDLPVGWITLEHGVRASVQEYTTMPADTVYFETHEKEMDIQYMVDGQELVGYTTRPGLVVRTPYDADNDITFYEQPALSGAVPLRAGDFLLLAPEDAHKPRCLAGKAQKVKKIVVKVPV